MSEITFLPLLAWPWIAALALLAVAVLLLALRRGAGAGLRGLALGAALLALAGPAWRQEARAPLADIVIALIDESASQRLAARPAQTARALERLRGQAAALGAELKEIPIPDGPDNTGTRAMTALNRALADLPRARIAGAVLLTDGLVHDAALLPPLPAPLHVLLTGTPADWDRRLIVSQAPAFGIVGEPLPLSLRISDEGAAPGETSALVRISFDGGAPFEARIPLNQEADISVKLPHGGINVMQISTPEIAGELTARNNEAVIQVNGVRDRLRVLLISGAPHPGARSWRNLLKSDASVDLVHFTILRPPDAQDYTPVSELSLIAFPTRELFLDKIDEFDLIIFDRYPLRGILTREYLENLRDYARRGGAVLIAAGPDFAGAQSIYRSPLGDIIPGAPTARVVERPYRPALTETGQRHPVTRGLLPEDGPEWGRWLRQIEITPRSGEILMEGAEGRPLLLLDRVERGRVALLASDQVWLWGRGYEGGGPQVELLRRLAHWLMKEPELEEDALLLEAAPGALHVVRRSLGGEVPPARLTLPDGSQREMPLEPRGPGLFAADLASDQEGLYRAVSGDLETVIVMGPPAPREYERTIASPAPLAPVAEALGGHIAALHEGQPALRRIREGARSHGRGWIGITSRDAGRSLSLKVTPLLPGWGWLMLVAGLVVLAWLWEGRREV